MKAPVAGSDQVYGLIYDVRMEDDPFVRQVATLAAQRPEIVEDQRQHRQVPIETAVLMVGYRRDDSIHHHLPPQPPLSLDILHACDDGELVEFTSSFGYFRLVLENRDLPVDELLAANLRSAAQARGAGAYDFLVLAGQELARLMPLDLGRLDSMLRRIRP